MLLRTADWCTEWVPQGTEEFHRALKEVTAAFATQKGVLRADQFCANWCIQALLPLSSLSMQKAEFSRKAQSRRWS